MKLENKQKSTTDNPAEIAAKAREWVVSAEGQRAVASGLQKAQSTSEKFREAQRVDPEVLHKPVTL